MFSASLTKLRFFVDLCNVSRLFVPSFVGIASPLNIRLENLQPKTFVPLNSKKLQVINTPKIALISPAVLVLPYSSGHMTLDTDECSVKIGCKLLQNQPEDTIIPIGCWSRSLTVTEQR